MGSSNDDPTDSTSRLARRSDPDGAALDKTRPRNRQLLIIEDDATFARIVSEIAARRGFKPIVASRGDVGLAMARQFRPDAILLDVRLPGLDGWSLLDHFKHDASIRHIPVVLVSGEDRRARAMRRGAFDYLLKPVSSERLEGTLDRINAFVCRAARRLLLVDGDDMRRREVLELVSDGDVETTAVTSGAEALQALTVTTYDCVVVAPVLPDTTAKQLITKLTLEDSFRHIPVIVQTRHASGLTSSLEKLPDEAVVRQVATFDALLDATTLFLHRVEDDLTDPKRRLLEKLRRVDPTLAGKRVLIVDDDARNVFALKSLLETQRMVIFTAYGGREGLDVLAREFPVDLVLMDVMMPEMDGYETIRAIRQVQAWSALTVFALTAKAMKGDRDRCIEAGASDYVAKPVDTAHLLSLFRVWLGP